MLDRLGRAIASEEIRDLMDVEDELDRIFDREMKKKDEIIAEKDKLLIEEFQKNLELQRQIDELKKQIKP